MFMEEKIGSPEAGKNTDIAIWDTDFYSAPPEAIQEALCRMTLFNGEVVYVAEEFQGHPPRVYPGRRSGWLVANLATIGP